MRPINMNCDHPSYDAGEEEVRRRKEVKEASAISEP